VGAAGTTLGARLMSAVTTPKVTIIIASHRSEYIDQCIKRCIEIIFRPSPEIAEIIVVSDYPVEIFMVSYPVVKWIYCPDKSIPKKRNMGIAQSRGTIVGFIDDDCIPMDNWVSHAIRYLEDNSDRAGVAGNTMVERREGISYPFSEFKRLETPSFRTNNIFYRKEAVLKVGGFDERFLFQREDVDLAFSMLEAALTIGYCADIKVIHCCRENERWDLIKNCVNRRFDPLLYKKHAPLYRKWIKTPITPSICLVTIFYCFSAISFLVGGRSCLLMVSLTLVCALSMGIKRNRFIRLSPGQVLRDWLSYIAAPFTLMAALVYGSIKYRKFLLF
jgi:glycosyltransferase involved in cell wall biosynthesis